LSSRNSDVPPQSGFSECQAVRQYIVLLRLLTLRFDFLGLAVETFRQIRKLQAGRIIPGQTPRDAQAERGFFFKAERIHDWPTLGAGRE
jgi:hypothetical protein